MDIKGDDITEGTLKLIQIIHVIEMPKLKNFEAEGTSRKMNSTLVDLKISIRKTSVETAATEEMCLC